MKKYVIVWSVLIGLSSVVSFYAGVSFGAIEERKEIKVRAMRFVDDHPLSEKDINIILFSEH